MAENQIIEKLQVHGIDAARLRKVLDSGDNWGELVHAFEALTVLGVVADEMIRAEEIGAAQARHPSVGGVQPLDVEVPGAVLEALREAQAADEARSGVHDVQRGKPNRRG